MRPSTSTSSGGRLGAMSEWLRTRDRAVLGFYALLLVLVIIAATVDILDHL